MRVGVRDVESGIVGEILRKPSCLKEHTVATGMIWKQRVHTRCAADTHNCCSYLEAVLCYCVTKYGIHFSQIRWSQQYLSYSNSIFSRLKVSDIQCWSLHHKKGLRSLNESKGDRRTVCWCRTASPSFDKQPSLNAGQRHDWVKSVPPATQLSLLDRECAWNSDRLRL